LNHRLVSRFAIVNVLTFQPMVSEDLSMLKHSLSSFGAILLLTLTTAIPACAQPAPGTTSVDRTTHGFYLAMGGASIAKAGAEGILFGVLSTNPQLSDYQQVIRDWYLKLLSDRELESDVSRMYARFFTEQEMKELTTFYHTPIGQKMLKSLPGIFKQTLIIGVKHTQGHGPELEDQLEKAVHSKDQDDEFDGAE
jgi:hypothetical protein